MNRALMGLLLAGCRAVLTPEDQLKIDEAIGSYLEACVRAEDAPPSEKMRAMRERDAVEMRIVSAAEDGVQGVGVRRSIERRGRALSQREQELKKQLPAAADPSPLHAELALVARKKVILSQLAAQVMR